MLGATAGKRYLHIRLNVLKVLIYTIVRKLDGVVGSASARVDQGLIFLVQYSPTSQSTRCGTIDQEANNHDDPSHDVVLHRGSPWRSCCQFSGGDPRPNDSLRSSIANLNFAGGARSTF
jgi:hypothetical protein